MTPTFFEDEGYKLPSKSEAVLSNNIKCGAIFVRRFEKALPTTTGEQMAISFSSSTVFASLRSEVDAKVKQLSSSFSASKAPRTLSVISRMFLLKAAIVAVTNAAFFAWYQMLLR